ncbi:MAG: acyl-CoA dehydrogenase [Proteobacteria bacterium]|nr:acyl-CoA dehydrogenase [Pseudomonadota bacterium]MBU1388845.1 acyl-CoA dehydrogenase [Pseudomonadota bacterium]MBU2481551.1 acyl-CoA dehydrogenase [Pseudomonadota bacterium]
MGHFKINQKDLLFILKEQLNWGSLCELDRYKGLNEKTLELLISEAINFAKGVVDPLNEIGEKQGVKWDKGDVLCPDEFKTAFRKYGEDGWTAAVRDEEYGGQGFPHMVRIIVNDIMYGASQSFNMAPSLTHGAAHLIESFGTKELKDIYLRNMYTGIWAGTMCLTEADAGSNLANTQTTAVPEGEHYKICGTKVFISWGNHDLTQNIIHLVLARIEGAPEGVRGISLFVVPKMRVNPDGSVGESNDVFCSGIEKKLGLHASPTAVLNFGNKNECIGYLCGTENMGLAHMFQMMNAARINTGVSGMSIASTAYRNALEYTRSRIQGRDIANRKKGDVAIIDHPDVRRNLLWMKAAVDGMRSLIYTGAMWSDLSQELPEGADKERYSDLVDFMTPIVKAYCSDLGFRVCEIAIQCLGGYGYCKDFPLEQYLRDSKIMSLYEGTNGIQATDLLGRKMSMKNGAPFLAFKAEVEKFYTQNSDHPELGRHIKFLQTTAVKLWELAQNMQARMKEDPLQWASYTYPALVAFGELTVVWRLLDMAVVAMPKSVIKGKANDFYRGKVLAATYFADVTLPHTVATIETCMRNGREILDIDDNAF